MTPTDETTAPVSRGLNNKGISILHRYILSQFLTAFLICLLTAAGLFLVFDLFERMNTFFREGATFFQIAGYLFFKIPFIVHSMTPVALLIATLISIGRLSQRSEITAMRACGVSLLWLAKPLLLAGLLISVLMLLFGEIVVPWSTQKVDQIYHIDIKRRVETGNFSREHFWHRSDAKFISIGFYDSRLHTLKNISIFDIDEQSSLRRRINADEASWMGPNIGWSMKNVIELSFDPLGRTQLTRYPRLPLVIPEKPSDFYDRNLKPQAMSYLDLRRYADKLSREGAPITRHLVDLAAKIAFPFVNLIVVLVAFPFALTPARSGSMTTSFVAAVSIGFGYFVVHALSTSLGAAELIPITASAWTANILLGSLGGYLILGTEHS